MKKNKGIIALAAIAVLMLVSSCATSPVPYSEASPVSISNLLEGYHKYSQPLEGTVRVVVVRDSGMLGSALPAKLSIDGTAVAELWSSHRLELFLIPDSYIFALEPSPKLGGALVEKEVQIKSGKSHSFRVSLDQSGSFSLQPSTQLQ